MSPRASGRDRGLEVLERVWELLQVDAEWGVRSARGFEWWPHEFRQSVRVDEGTEERGRTVWRVEARADWGLRPADIKAKREAIELVMPYASMNGLVIDSRRKLLQVACAAYVHEGNAEWVGDMFAWAVAMQASEAHARAALADGLGIEPARSAHPESGLLPEPDDMLNVGQLVVSHGAEESCWTSPADLDRALEVMEEVAMVATGNGGLSAEFAWGPDGKPAMLGGPSSLLSVLPDMEHPQLGSGLLCTLRLPERPRRRGRRLSSLGLNAVELSSFTLAHFLGSWAPDPSHRDPTYVTFVPNAVHQPGLLANIALSIATRARWVSDLHHAQD